MYLKFETKEQGKRFTFFERERTINGEPVKHTAKTVFGRLSEGIKTGSNHGKDIWENDYWDATFCGKAYEKALQLKNKDRIVVMEMNVRNVCVNKKSYPQIMVTDFELYAASASGGDEFAVPEDDAECPFD